MGTESESGRISVSLVGNERKYAWGLGRWGEEEGEVGGRVVKIEREDFSRKRKHRLMRLEDKIHICDQMNLLDLHILVFYLHAWQI